MLGIAGEFGGVGVFPTRHVSRELDHRHLHAETDAEIGNVILAREAGGLDLAFHAALAESARHQNGVLAGQTLGAMTLDQLGIDVLDVDLHPRLDAGMDQRLVERLVGVEQLHVLADHGDVDRLERIELGVEDMDPLGQIRLRRLEAELVADDIVEPLLVQHQRNAIDGIGILQRDDRTLFDVGEQRDLAPLALLELDFAAADQDIGLDTDRAQLLDAVLGRLGLGLAGGLDVGHQRQVHEQRAVGTHFAAQLTDGFQERQRFDVTDGAADLHQRHVVTFSPLDHTMLDLVGDVRNHLHRAAEIVATALLAQHMLVDPAGGEVVALGHLGTDEALVVAQVEIGFRAILGDEHLAMLERTHGARIDVDVRIQLEDGDLEAAGLEDRSQRSGCNTLAQGGHNAAGHEDISCHGKPVESWS